MKDPRLLITDLDGTFLEPDGSLPANAAAFIATIRGLGADVWIATSRSPHNVSALFAPLRDAGIKISVCSDGGTTVMLYPSEVEHWSLLQEQLIDKGLARAVLRILHEGPECPSEKMVFTGAGRSFDIIHHSRGERGVAWREMSSRLGDERVLHATPDFESFSRVVDLCDGIRAVSCLDTLENIERSVHSLAEFWSDARLSCRVYSETRIDGGLAWLDITSSAANKGDALRAVLSHAARDGELIGLGNGENDLPFFRHCDLTLCPSASAESVRRAADIIAPVGCGSEFLQFVLPILVGRYRR